MRYFLGILVCLLFHYSGKAQHYWKAAGRFSELNGLSTNSVTDITLDNNGFAWIGTAIGLNRFDGKNFRVFRQNFADTNSLQSNLITKLTVDNKNRIWIGYAAGGVSCYDQLSGLFRHFYPDSAAEGSLAFGGIDEIFADPAGRIWIGVAFEGLYMYDPVKDKIINYGPLPFVSKERTKAWQRHYNRISEFEVDPDGKLWIATGDGLYSLIPESRKFEVHRFSEGPENIKEWKPDVFNTICRLDDRGFYLGGWGTGINYYDRTTKKWKTWYIYPDKIHSGVNNITIMIRKKSDHEIWVSTADTILSVFDTKAEEFFPVPYEALTEGNINIKSISCLLPDKNDNLWVGHPGGFNILNLEKPEFTFTRHPVTFSTNGLLYSIADLLDDPVSGNTFVATSWADGLNIIKQDGSITHYMVDTADNPERNLFIGELLMDSKQRIWITTYTGFQQYDRSADKLIEMPPPVSDTSLKGYPICWKMEEDTRGMLWIATTRHGVYCFDPATLKYVRLLHKDNKESPLLTNYITGLECTPDGNVWIAYNQNGISKFEPATGKITHFARIKNDSTSLIDNKVVCLHADDEGTLWVGTMSGLCKLNYRSSKPRFNNFIKGQDFLGTVVYALEMDHSQNLWISESKGITILNPRTLKSRTYNYTSNGLRKEYGVTSISRGRNHQMLLGTVGGYFRIREDVGMVSVKPDRVFITEFYSGGLSINIESLMQKGGTVHLPASNNFFTISFISKEYKQYRTVVYSYRLVGADEQWRPLTREGMAIFSQLPGGNYVFEVKAQSETGSWSEVTSLPIIIATPFYKTTWFNMLVALTAASSIFALYRFRIRTVERAEALKTKLNKQLAETEMKALRAQMNPHFIFNGLNSINRYIIKNDHKTASLYLTKFAKLIRHILDNSEHQEIPLSQEIDTLKLYIDIEALRFDSMFTYKIEVADDVYTDSVMIPPMLIQPYVENAIWHGLLHKSTPGHMTISFMQEPGLLVCTITDDGVGREKAAEMKSKSATTRKSLGLKITSDRIEMLGEKTGKNGSVVFEDLFNSDGSASGTRVIVRIPIEDE